jgi:hypothetical protein
VAFLLLVRYPYLAGAKKTYLAPAKFLPHDGRQDLLPKKAVYPRGAARVGAYRSHRRLYLD